MKLPRFSLRTLVVFTLLATSGFGLWYHWEPWYSEGGFNPNPHLPLADYFLNEFSSDSEVLKVHVIWAERDSSSFPRGPNGEITTWPCGARTFSFAVSTGELLGSSKSSRVHGVPCTEEGVLTKALFAQAFEANTISADGTRTLGLLRKSGKRAAAAIIDARDGSPLFILRDVRFIRTAEFSGAWTFSPDSRRVALAVSGGDICFYRRRRPEWWWGVFYLKEFWLTAALAGLFVWSVVRERRALGVLSPE